jgi:diguanylate cyclase (GGDEF)-like protein/PAS domain S-box-containing protein
MCTNTSDDRYRLLVEHMSDAVFEATIDGVITWISPSVERLSGWRQEDVIGHNVDEFVEPETVASVDALAAQVGAGETVMFTGRSIRPNGDYQWVSVSVAPLDHSDGSVSHSVGVVRDVDAIVRARLELAASEEYFRLLADHVGDVVLRMDRALNIQWVSPSARHLLLCEPSDLIGVALDSLIHPDDWARHYPVAHHVRDEHHPAAPPAALLLRVLRGDGSWCWVSGRPNPVIGDDGTLLGVVTTWSDVNELVEAREDAHRANDRLRATLDSLMDPHIIITPVVESGEIVDFDIIEVNEAVTAYYDRDRESLIGARYRDVMTTHAATAVFPLDVKVAETGVPLVLDDFPLLVNGVERRFDLRAVKVGDNVSHTWRDVTHRHDVEVHLSHLATHDTLTGLANRGALIDELSRALIAARRSGRPVGLVMLDLDHFKTVNDTVGHAMGDQLLKAVARRLEAGVRGGDLVARLGGDEFVIVMRDMADPSEAVNAAERVVAAFRQPIMTGGLELLATTSVGVVIAPADASVESALREVDAAMYRAKRAGRDQMAIFNDDLREAAQARSKLETQLRPALSLGELALHYQPEIDLVTGKVCAVEALLRWHHPSGELYPASRFIDLAEDIGVILDSTDWLIHEASAAARRWNDQRPDLGLRLRLNLSRQQLADPTLLESFDHAISAAGIDPSMLVVDIGEEAFVEAPSTLVAALTELGDRGIGIAIDNFVTGYGALGYLGHRTLRVVRLDRTFLRGASESAHSARLVAGLVAFAHHLDLGVAADGVETHHDAHLMKSLGCATAQGYYFAPPMPPEEVAEQLGCTFAI